MKKLLFILSCMIARPCFAQTTTETTTVTTNKDTTAATTAKKQGKRKFKFDDQYTRVDSARRGAARKPGFNFGVTFSRFDLGLTTLVDNGSFTLSPKNDFLSYRSWKSSNVGFDVLEFGYRFTNHFKVYLSGGFDWTLIRLRNNITIQKDAPVLTYTTDAIDYSKNRFSSSYLRIPLSFEFRGAVQDGRRKRFRFIVGPEAGLLLDGMVKQISQENGKQKFDDDYHFAQMRYGAFARIGYGSAGLFAKYYFNDMFENSPAQAGLRNFAFGLTFGF